jgi:hypothetical protein
MGTDVKRKYREAMRDKADRMRGLLDEDEEAIETRDWFDEWAATLKVEHEASDVQTEMTK